MFHKVKLYNITTGEELLFLFSFGDRDQMDVLEDLLDEQVELHPGTRWNGFVCPPFKPVASV